MAANWCPKHRVGNDAIHLDDLEVSFHRTLRVPDGHDSTKLPPSLGRFPLYNATEYAKKLSPEMAKKGGVFFPMYRELSLSLEDVSPGMLQKIANRPVEREALWIKFDSEKPYAVKLFVGGVNAVSGRPLVETLGTTAGQQNPSPHQHKPVQDYMIVPDQRWIDGIAVEPGVVRQFVAMPTGSGYSVEVQVTGNEEFAGMLFSVTPRMMPSRSGGFHDRTRNVKINVVSLGHDAFTIPVSLDDTVDDLKFLIHSQENISPYQHELRLSGRNLEGTDL